MLTKLSAESTEWSIFVAGAMLCQPALRRRHDVCKTLLSLDAKLSGDVLLGALDRLDSFIRRAASAARSVDWQEFVFALALLIPSDGSGAKPFIRYLESDKLKGFCEAAVDKVLLAELKKLDTDPASIDHAATSPLRDPISPGQQAVKVTNMKSAWRTYREMWKAVGQPSESPASKKARLEPARRLKHGAESVFTTLHDALSKAGIVYSMFVCFEEAICWDSAFMSLTTSATALDHSVPMARCAELYEQFMQEKSAAQPERPATLPDPVDRLLSAVQTALAQILTGIESG